MFNAVGNDYRHPNILEIMEIKNRKIMAKATLEYDLNDFDDAMAHRRAIKSTDMAIVLHEIQYNLHKRIEHELEGKEFEGKSVSEFEVIQIYREKIAELFEENNINIDELIR